MTTITTSVAPYAPESYNGLLRAIRQEIEAGIALARQAVEHQGVVTNWRIGRYINEFMLPGYGPSSANAELVQRLAKDLSRPASHMYAVAKFYRAYPDEGQLQGLTWSHYKALIRIEDPSERRRYEQLALSQRISGKNLQDLVREDKKRNRAGRLKARSLPKHDVPQIPVLRGRLHHYKLMVHKHHIEDADRILVDLGFDIRREIAPVPGQKYRSGYVVRSIREGSQQYQTRMAVHAGAQELYTYIAYVERLIRADMYLVHIDCGFEAWIEKTVQLRGIKAPALTEHRGRSAKEFAAAILREANFVIIKMYRSDENEYQADIFFEPGETDPVKVSQSGRFLNQELLDKHLADPDRDERGEE